MNNQKDAIKDFVVAISKELTERSGSKVKNSMIREAISHYFNHHDWNTFSGVLNKTMPAETFQNEDVVFNADCGVSESLILFNADCGINESLILAFCTKSKRLKIKHHSFAIQGEIEFLLEYEDLCLFKKYTTVEELLGELNFGHEPEDSSKNVRIVKGLSVDFEQGNRFFSINFGSFHSRKEIEELVKFMQSITENNE